MWNKRSIIITIFLHNVMMIIDANKQSDNADGQNTPPFEKYLKKTFISNYIRTRDLTKNRRTMAPAKKVMDIIDITDELLNFDIDKVKIPEEVILNNSGNDSRRFFNPPGKVLPWAYPQGNRDYYNLRARLYELMKQTMYEARDALPIIQELRSEYNWHSLYKMGFLFSKTDDQAKLFNSLAKRFFFTCRIARTLRNSPLDRLNPTLLNEFYERILNHWLETDMLVNMIRVNDASARKTLRSMEDLRELDDWFVDEFEDIYHVQKKAAADKKQKKTQGLWKAEEEKMKHVGK